VDSGSPSSSNGSNTATHNITGHSSAKQPPVCAASSKHPHSTATAAVHPSTGPDAVVWRELLQLQSGPLVGSLMRLSPDVWPGSGSMAVQLLVFYLNWLRRWWSKVGLEVIWLSAVQHFIHAQCRLTGPLAGSHVAADL
jgi:hypothetical protein